MCQIYKFCDYCGAQEYSLKLLLKSVVRLQACSSTLWPERPPWRSAGGSEINSVFRQIKLGLAQRDTWPPPSPLTPDRKVQVNGPSGRSASWAVTRSENLSEGVGGPSWSSDDGSATVCHHNCTDQHLLIQQCTKSKDIIGWICSVYGSEHIEMLTSAD